MEGLGEGFEVVGSSEMRVELGWVGGPKALKAASTGPSGTKIHKKVYVNPTAGWWVVDNGRGVKWCGVIDGGGKVVEDATYMICLTVNCVTLKIQPRRTDPYCIIAHLLDVIQLRHETVPCTTTVYAVASVTRGVVGWRGESVRHDSARKRESHVKCT